MLEFLYFPDHVQPLQGSHVTKHRISPLHRSSPTYLPTHNVPLEQVMATYFSCDGTRTIRDAPPGSGQAPPGYAIYKNALYSTGNLMCDSLYRSVDV